MEPRSCGELHVRVLALQYNETVICSQTLRARAKSIRLHVHTYASVMMHTTGDQKVLLSYDGVR